MKYLKNQYLLAVIMLFVVTSCQQTSNDLSKSFSCNNPSKLTNFETVKDFKNNFSIDVPKSWKTKLYYDNVQSEIFSADTIKELSDSYIMDFSVINNTMKIDEKLREKVFQKTQDNDMETVKEMFYTFKTYKAFANLSKGKSRGLDLYVFQTYIHINEEKHMLIKTEYYGNEDFDLRFCESLSIIDRVKIFK